MQKPHRAVTLTLDLQADTRNGIISDLEHIIRQIERGEMTTGCVGGPTSGYRYAYQEHGEPTHSEYFRQVTAWLAAHTEQETGND